jgi:hypothetical protein
MACDLHPTSIACFRVSIFLKGKFAMKRTMPNLLTDENFAARAGKIKYALVLWLMGAPLFLVFIAAFVRGCDF